MKYEFRSCGRLLIPFFGLALIVAGLLRLVLVLAPLIWEPAANILTGLAASLGILLLVAVILLAFVVVIVRFYQGMVAREGYLSFTLPVTVNTHLMGRTLVGTVYSLVSVVIAALCGLIFIPGFLQSFTGLFVDASQTLPADLTAPLILHIIGLVLVTVIISILSNLVKVYCSLAIGTQLAKNRVVGGVAAYLILSTGESIISIPLILIPAALTVGFSNTQMSTYFSSLVNTESVHATFNNIMGLMWVFVAVITVYTLVITVAEYLITHHIFAKKLNLE